MSKGGSPPSPLSDPSTEGIDQSDSQPRRVTELTVMVPIRDRTGRVVGRAVLAVAPVDPVPEAWIVGPDGVQAVASLAHTNE